MVSYEELSELFEVLRGPNESFSFWANKTPPAIAGDLDKLSGDTHEGWGFVDMVDKNGDPWDPSQAGVERVTIFVFATSEGRGTCNQRVVIRYIYSPPGGLWDEPDYWSGLSRPLCYYRDYHRETGSVCGTGDCYCLECTAAMIIQRRYFRWKHDRVTTV